MKKILVALFLVILLITTCFPVYAQDLTELTTDEIMSEILSLQNELSCRSALSDKKLILYDIDGLTVSIENISYFVGYLRVSLRIVNNSVYSVDIYGDDGTVNGWKLYSITGNDETNPGEKRKDATITFQNVDTDAELTSLDQLVTLSLSMSFRRKDSNGKEVDWLRPAPVECIYSPEAGLMVIPQ